MSALHNVSLFPYSYFRFAGKFTRSRLDRSTVKRSLLVLEAKQLKHEMRPIKLQSLKRNRKYLNCP